MCDIMIFPKGVSIPTDKLENVVLNNPHGFGLVLKNSEHKKLEIIRRFHPNGTDPKEIEELLNDNKNLERYLHVRWRTEGEANIENVHPFCSYNSNSREVYFMHNGTLSDFKPKNEIFHHENGVKVVDLPAETISDSKKFNDEFLSPLLLKYQGEKGKGDTTDPLLQTIIHKHWNSPLSTGVLISNDLDPTLINRDKWKELDYGMGKFYSSNDTYFDKLIRGPVFEFRKKEKEEEERKLRVSRFHNNGSRSHNSGITDLKDLDLKPKEIITEDLSTILEDWDLSSDKGLATLELLAQPEINQLVTKAPDASENLIILLTGTFARMYEKTERIKKHLKEIKSRGKSNIDVKDIMEESN